MGFLELIRQRFEGKDQSVPWYLDDKVNACEFAKKNNVKSPKTIKILENIDELKNLELPKKFVLKISNAHSCIGVMPLEKMANGKYFDHVSLNEYNLDEVIKNQKQIAIKRKGAYWIIEQFLTNFMPEKAIPFDYKVYCFYGVPKMIEQIDRNANPPKVALFDGTFFPLKYGEDYYFDFNRWVPGNHVIPPHAAEIIRTAAKLSSITDKYVRVDMYDTPEGVYFGEFTFAPGAPDVGFLKFSKDILSHFDASLEQKLTTDFNCRKGFTIDVESFLASLMLNNVPSYDSEYYQKLSSRASNGDSNAIRRLTTLFPLDGTQNMRKISEHFSLAWKYISYIQKDNDLTFSIIENVQNKKGFVNGVLDMNAIHETCRKYLMSKGETSVWYKIRYAQFLLEYGNSSEYKEAEEILNQYASKNEFARSVIRRNRS